MYQGYGIWKAVHTELSKTTDINVRNFQKYNQIKQAYLKGTLKKETPLIFLRFSDGDHKLQNELSDQGYTLFPEPSFSNFVRNREDYLPVIDTLTQYPLKRIYLDQFDGCIYDVITENFGGSPVVIKVGNLHASEAKWLVTKQTDLPYLNYDLRKLPITIEEFVPDARSIRIGCIGDATDFNNYFITEHINSKTWLKNKAPEQELTYSYADRHTLGVDLIDDLISEVQEIAVKYKANLLGVDWVINANKVGLLELNDMIGLPEGEFALHLFTQSVKQLYSNKV